MDQQLNKTNAALASNCKCKFDDQNGGDAGDDWKKGKPIRVLRNYKGAKHSKYAPKEGNRYDGIYKLVKYWPQKGKSGFIVWRYLLRRDDPTPAPWTKEGKKIMEEAGYGPVIYPENYQEMQEEKARKKAEKEKEKNKENGGEDVKGGKKRKKPEEDDNDEEKVSESKKLKTITNFKINDNLKLLMKEDDLNEKVWDDIMAKSLTNKKELTDIVEEQFLCLICQDLAFNPVTTPCRHNVCKGCVDRSFKAKVRDIFRCLKQPL